MSLAAALLERSGALLSFIKSSVSDQGYTQVLKDNKDFKTQIGRFYQKLFGLDHRKQSALSAVRRMDAFADNYSRYTRALEELRRVDPNNIMANIQNDVYKKLRNFYRELCKQERFLVDSSTAADAHLDKVRQMLRADRKEFQTFEAKFMKSLEGNK